VVSGQLSTIAIVVVACVVRALTGKCTDGSPEPLTTVQEAIIGNRSVMVGIARISSFNPVGASR
jgi:hypothetical protein